MRAPLSSLALARALCAPAFSRISPPPSALRAAPASLSRFSSSSPAAAVPAGVRAAFDEVCATRGPAIAASGSNADKLRAYALFKQATAGPAPAGARPGVQ